MASRLMHLAISREMLRQRRLGDFDRFFSWLHPSGRLRSGSKIRSVSPEIPAEKQYFFTEILADEYIGRAVEF